MAPDRGRDKDTHASDTDVVDDAPSGSSSPMRPVTPTGHSGDPQRLVQGARKEPVLIEGHSFTFRGVGVGLAIGLVLTCTNISMGLQSGWVSSMTMPASLMGFGFFKLISKHLKFPFSPVENVLVQTVAGSMGIMPLGCGLVGVVSLLLLIAAHDSSK